MVNHVAGRNSVGLGGTFTAGAPKKPENKELETLQNQAAKLAEILSGSRDSVEISDEARALYNAAEKSSKEPETSTQNAARKSMDSKEGREAIASGYNAVLDEFRSRYGEEEAMRRFDEFMKSEGFEKVEADGADVFGNGVHIGTSTDPRSHFNGASVVVERADAGGNVSNALRENGVTFNNDSSLHLRSTIRADRVNGANKRLAETTASFAAEYSDDVLRAMDSFFNRNLDDLQKGVGFDLAAEMKKHSPTGQISAVSTNKDLAAITNDLLRQAGITLGAGESLSMRLATDENGVVTGLSVGDEQLQKAIDRAVSDDPSILRAFANEYGSVAFDADSLDGQYGGAGRSVEYVHAGREFILSGDDPSTMIMADRIGVQSTGYTYQKKVSDSFDPDADSVSVIVRGGGDELAREIDDALKSGATIASTVSEEEFNALPTAVDERIRKFFKPDRTSSFYVDPEMVRRQMEAVAAGKDPMAIAKEYDTHNEAEAVDEADMHASAAASDDIISYDDAQSALHQLTLSAIMKMLNSRRGIFGGNAFGMYSSIR